MLSNLLEETKFCIEASGHTVKEITFIGSQESGHSCSWEKFRLLADKTYDSGFGAQQVAKDLIIVFADGQKMWRSEYDGSEWWDFVKLFEQPEKTKPIERLIGNFWPTLEELHDIESKGYNW